MDRRIPIVFAACMMILGTIPTTIAVTGHNLVMGFEMGDQFHYRYSNNETGDRFDFYVKIDKLPMIGADIDAFIQIYVSDMTVSYYFENATEFDSLSFHSLWWSALPIGNWSFLQALYEKYPPYDSEFINTTSDWGVHYSYEPFGATVTWTQRFSKIDGALNLLEIIYDRDAGITRTIQIVREGTSIDLYLTIAGVAAVVVIAAIAAVVMKRR